jgi:hypothetical protein
LNPDACDQRICSPRRRPPAPPEGPKATAGGRVWFSPREPVVAAGRILDMMKPAHAATRRFLPTSPFKPPPAAPPAEQFAVEDQVTHDKYGLGRVVSVEDDTALVVDFGTHQVRITTPYAKLTKL